jgi:hypothetical protein
MDEILRDLKIKINKNLKLESFEETLKGIKKYKMFGKVLLIKIKFKNSSSNFF